MERCLKCAVTEDDAYLVKCPVCHKMVCEDHKYSRSGRSFCTPGCASLFFTEEDDEGEG